MAAFSSPDLDGLTDSATLDLATALKEEWQPRDEAIARAVELRKHAWSVPVPKAWRRTAVQQHSALAKEIPARVMGTLTLREPQFSRAGPDVDETQEERANAVERGCQGLFQHYKRKAVGGKNSWMLQADHIINKGAVCSGSIFAPHSWAGVLRFTLDGTNPKPEWWRDETGRPTVDPDTMDYQATARHYLKAVDLYRRQAKPPIVRRVPEPETCYPLFLEGEVAALVIEHKVNALELAAGGFVTELAAGEVPLLRRSRVLREVWTPNRCRYYLDDTPLRHKVFGSDGLVHGYGFVPFSYRVGLEGGSTDYGDYGLPLLALIDSNLRFIDSLLTYAFNAIHLTSFPSFYVKYVLREGVHAAELIETQTGRPVTAHEFQSGMIMDFGPDREIMPLIHPGMNKDFYQFLQFNIDEVHRIIPRTLQGIAESSGYNTVQSSVQAKSIFNPCADGMELHLQELAIMDLQHIAKRVPGPIYMNLETHNPLSSRPKKVRRITLSAQDIRNYYDVTVTIDRELDRITNGTWAANLEARGIVSKPFVLEVSGITDSPAMEQQIRRDQALQTPEIAAVLTEDAIEEFGIKARIDEWRARQRLVQGQDGTPLVKQKDGSLFGPGVGVQTPQMQGMIGAQMGGMNPLAPPGQSNLNAVANPSIGLPAPTPTNRPRGRRRGGAIPGAPQRPHQPAEPQNAAAP